MVILVRNFMRQSVTIILRVWPLWAGLLFMIMQMVAHAAPVRISDDRIARLTKLDASPANLGQKQKLLLYFWATWCPSCRDKLTGKLASLAEREDLDVWTVNLDQSRDRAQSFVERERIKVQVVRDETKTLQELFQVSALPHWVLLEKAEGTWNLVDSGTGATFQRVDEKL